METRTDPVDAPAPLSPADIRSIFAGLVLVMMLAALDQTIVATALPTIGRDLNDAQHLPWIATAYLLASTAVTPLYGKLSDMHGRRSVLLVALGIFLLGSVACALAPNLLVLVVARAVQGMGGGGLIALAQTIVADMVSPRERGHYQVYFGMAFASANLAGPVLGGYLSTAWHWSLIFWINLPFGAVAFWMVNGLLKKLPVRRRPHRLDVLGALLMSAGTICLLLALSWGGLRFPWFSVPIAGLFAAAAILWATFMLRLRTATEPLIPLAILNDKVVRLAIGASALGLGTFVGLTIFTPIFFELGLGLSARESGLALIPLVLGIVVGSTASGRAMARYRHYKRIPLAGLTLSFLCVSILAATAARVPFWTLEILFALTSLGLGTLMPVATVAVQNAVEPGHLGTATAMSNFARQLAGAVGVAIFGAIVLGGNGRPDLTLETLGASGDPALAAGFQPVFVAAALGLAASLACFIAMEERPFRDRA